MIDIQDIYKSTDDGLDIIKLCVSNPVEVAEAIRSNKAFALRQEKTPSTRARIYNVDGKNGPYQVWKVTDFGDTGHAESPVDLYMRVHCITSYGEAVARLADHFGISDSSISQSNRPRIEKKQALPDQEEGKKYFRFKESFTKEELAVLGPNVTQDTCKSLHWYSAEWVCDIKDRMATYKFSTSTYPIFVRECIIEGTNDVFYKIYEPLNSDKRWRFQYTPVGKKPKSYINGLAELKKSYTDYNKQLEIDFAADPQNDEKVFKPEKLEEAIICSGERDSLCCRALGYHPLWLNSETYSLTSHEYKEIMKYVKILYNIPDLDSTGLAKGRELALRYIDIHTIWLPNYLTKYKDNRGRPRKDFRDWSELRPRVSDFKKLLNLAKPAKFWTSRWVEKKKDYSYEIDSDCLRYFLKLHGYHTLHDDNSITPRYIQITGNIVKSVTTKDIYNFIIRWAEENYLERDVRNLILNSPRISGSVIANLEEVDLDFTKCTDKSQLFFFLGNTYEVTADEVICHDGVNTSIDRYVWHENVLQHRVTLQDPPFHITNNEGKFDITINNTRSKFFCYLINSSRIYWRKELEEHLHGMPEEEAATYKSTHKFCIDGDGLSNYEIAEQKQNLINKIFGIGFWLHRFKSASKAWALYAMDNTIDESGACNGRSGKSFYFKVLSNFGKTVKLSGRNPKLMDNPHVFDQVNQHTDYILVDDCDKYLQTGIFYDIITSDLTVNPKNNQSFTIPFEQSPKLAFTTNFVPSDFDPSTDARLVYLAFSDYYHQKTEDNDYIETRSIRDDFGKDLFGTNYSEQEWSDDCNFFMRCCQFYLSVSKNGTKIQPPMTNIIKRKLMNDMAGEFGEWAEAYFDATHTNAFIEKDEAMNDFIKSYNVKGLSSQRFMRSLRAFVELNPGRFELNPVDLQNSSGRIIRKSSDGKAKIMLYLRTIVKHDDNGSGFTPDEHEIEPF